MPKSSVRAARAPEHQPEDVAATIESMTQRMRTMRCLAQSSGFAATGTSGCAEAGADSEWWLLLCGGELDPDDADQREAARQDLARAARILSLETSERMWVWDENDSAQLVVGSYASSALGKDALRKLAGAAGNLGYRLRLIKAWK